MANHHQTVQHTRFPSDTTDNTIVDYSGFDFSNTSPVQNTSYHGKPAASQGIHIQEFVSPALTQSSKWSNGSKPVDEKVHNSRKPIVSFPRAGSWTFEIASLALAVGAVVSIIAILAHFDGKPLPSFPSTITLNAVIAVLTTVANASLAVPLSSGLGQLKWERVKAGYSPLRDMEYIDEASRGALGALNLLRRFRGGTLGSTGALAVIVGLVLSPFAQQIATYNTRMTPTSVNGTNWRALSYSFALPGLDASAAFVPVLPLKAAVYNGLFAENGKPWLSLPVNCPTGNCIWEPFESLAVCNSCVDMSEYMTRYCPNGISDDGDTAECGWSLPSGAVLNSSDVAFSMTSEFSSETGEAPYSTIMKLIFMGTEAQAGQAGRLQPWARQCTLQACVQTIESVITNGELQENVTSIVTNTSVVSTGPGSTDMEPIVIHTNTTKDGVPTDLEADFSSYTLSKEAMISMQSWFAELFTNGTASRNKDYISKTLTSANNAAIKVNLTVGISSGETFFDTDIVQAFYWNYYEYPSGLDMLMNDLATSLTVAFRSLWGQEAVNGTTLSQETFVHVRWGFMTAPLLAVLLTTAFLTGIIYMSWSPGADLWKTSVLGLLFHGLDEYTREKFEESDRFEAQRALASNVKTRLEQRTGDGLLLRVEDRF